MIDTAALAAHGLTKSYGRHRAVEDVTFVVERGQICGLLGPNGAGKTTSMRMLAGLSRPDGGTARLLGEPSRLAAAVLARAGVAIDGPAFVPHLTGRRNLELAWRAGSRRWPPPALEPSLELAGLGEALDRKVKGYSMGMRQRLMLAQALMGAPEVLILDEPASGLDPGEVRTLREQLRRLAAGGAAILISSHVLAEIELLATHCVVMNAGAVITTGSVVVLAGVTEAGKAGGRGGPATFSALNFTESGLNFMDPVLFGLVVVMLGSIIGGSDRDWGTLRYLYLRPVTRARLVAGKWWAMVVCCVLTVAVFVAAALHTVVAALPVHYWLGWTSLFGGAGGGSGGGLTEEST